MQSPLPIRIIDRQRCWLEIASSLVSPTIQPFIPSRKLIYSGLHNYLKANKRHGKKKWWVQSSLPIRIIDRQRCWLEIASSLVSPTIQPFIPSRKLIYSGLHNYLKANKRHGKKKWWVQSSLPIRIIDRQRCWLEIASSLVSSTIQPFIPSRKLIYSGLHNYLKANKRHGKKKWWVQSPLPIRIIDRQKCWLEIASSLVSPTLQPFIPSRKLIYSELSKS